jgi:hypothetical protein
MRTFRAVLFFLAVFLLVAPAPAHAWFGWLDNLSGPGPFNGLEVDFRVVCFMDQPSWDRPFAATTAVKDLTTRLVNTLKTPPAAEIPRASTPGDLITSVPDTHVDRSLALNTLQGALKMLEKDLGKLDSPNPTGRTKALEFSGTITNVHEDLQSVFKHSNTVPQEAQRNWLDAWETASRLWRESAVPGKGRPEHLGLAFWASCTNRLEREPESAGAVILHRDRHPLVSLGLNFRDLANTAKYFHLAAQNARDSNNVYAGGAAITLRILEPKLSWPMSGRFDLLDGQAGAGVYQFSSHGFATGAKSFTGLVFEPIRFDVHFPGSLIDRIHGKYRVLNFLERLPLSVSYSAGVLMFPYGFSADKFVSGNPGDVGRAISGSEALFEQGVVLNVGRLFGL